MQLYLLWQDAGESLHANHGLFKAAFGAVSVAISPNCAVPQGCAGSSPALRTVMNYSCHGLG
jgi:hypothetical protein